MSSPRNTTRITDAGVSQQEDVKGRMVRYAIAMGIRTACFIGAIVTFSTLPWVALALAVAAVVLPYIAVLLANIGPARPDDHAGTLLDGPPPERLSPERERPEPAAQPRRAANAPTTADAPVVLEGHVIHELESRPDSPKVRK